MNDNPAPPSKQESPPPSKQLVCKRCNSCPCVWDVHRQQVLLEIENNQPSSDKACRFKCYRLFSRALRGVLGVGERMQLPDCVVDGVRSVYPDKNSEYVGFRD